MGLLSSFMEANTMAKVTVFILLVTNLFNFLAFFMNEWGLMDTLIANEDHETGYGVWTRCGRLSTPDCIRLDGWVLPWYSAFQAFATIGFVAINLAFLFFVLVVFVPQCKGNKEVAMAGVISSGVGVVGYFIAICIFGANFDSTYDLNFDEEELYASFYIAIFLVILAIIALITGYLSAGKGAGSVGDAESGGARKKEKRQKPKEKKGDKGADDDEGKKKGKDKKGAKGGEDDVVEVNE